MARKKRPQKFQQKTGVRAKAKTKGFAASCEKANTDSRVWIGADLSLHSLALAGLGYDSILDKYVGPSFISVTWNSQDHYFTRLKEMGNCHTFVIDLLTEMKMLPNSNQVFIAQEEPWPFGMANRGKGQSKTLKQQAEMSGAFLAGLLTYGYSNVYQIHNTWWRKIVADDLGITTHYTKWGKGLVGKMRCKEWSLFHNDEEAGLWAGQFPREIPEWPDLIADSKDGGRKPKPENSKAKALQPDDRYQALPMALWMLREERGENAGS